MIKLKTTEKSVRLVELENTLVIEVDRQLKKPEIKKEFEKYFGGKVKNMRTQIRANKKIVFIRLDESTPAIDIATKFGMI
jgi:large subunit ribosomal protein L23